jgi:hypothetical protein
MRSLLYRTLFFSQVQFQGKIDNFAPGFSIFPKEKINKFQKFLTTKRSRGLILGSFMTALEPRCPMYRPKIQPALF